MHNKSYTNGYGEELFTGVYFVFFCVLHISTKHTGQCQELEYVEYVFTCQADFVSNLVNRVKEFTHS